MKNSIPKVAIPDSKVFVIKQLEAPYFDPIFHFHQEYQLFLVLQGEGTRFIGDNMKPFKKGDLVFTGPNLPHVWRSDNCYFDKTNNLKTTGIVIYFHDHFLGEPIHHEEEFENIRHLLQKSVRGLEINGDTNRKVSKMMVELLELKGIKSIIQLLKILDITANSPECHFITHKHYVPINTEAETNRMNKVYEYVMKNFKQKIRLEEVAAIANMTPTSFSRYFKSRVNKSFSDFLKEIRIDYARKLLSEEDMNINQIGYECGFHNISNFNKQFKKVTGDHPFHYRIECLKVQIEVDGNF
ncbi:AraC family transcriptional regulator [Daejeonella sp.]|uniref:AraC family transcriptional regulator n=1 Tax=Daejeonella sp. TaxID=2805397 RepID=UPI003983A8D3